MAKSAKPKKPAGSKKRPVVAKSIKAAAGNSIQGINAEAFEKLQRRLKSPQRVMDENRGSIGGIIAAAVENDHLHKGAFGMIRRLVKLGQKSGVSLGEFLFHFDLMREHADLDSLAAADMLEDRQRKETEAKEAKAAAKANGKDDKGASADMKSGAVSLDAKRAEKASATGSTQAPDGKPTVAASEAEQAGALLN